jgi:cell fate regulator YaaT (PSP1 superfamily)
MTLGCSRYGDPFVAAKHLVRWGTLGFVAAFSATDAARYPRGARVVVRTTRGLELGEILTPLADDSTAPHEGAILRGMTDQDQLLETRLVKNRDEAYAACREKLAQRGLDVALMDVEHLFDGRSLIFYFLGEQPPELARLTEELADAYDAQVQFRAFADAVVAGCGPDCGTENAAGCGSCGTGCAVAAACSVAKQH